MWTTSIAKAFDHAIESNCHDKKARYCDIGNRTEFNLALQVALYLNVWLFPAWLVIMLVNLNAKYYYLTDVYQILMVAVFIVLSISEALRLYLGYVGNLAGKIAELAVFWLISALIQFPLEVFLIFDVGTRPQHSETSVNCLMLFLLVIEIITGTAALKRWADHYAKIFYLMQFCGTSDTSHQR